MDSEKVLGKLSGKITDEMLIKLQRDGFLIVDEALPATLCEILRSEMDTLLENEQMWSLALGLCGTQQFIGPNIGLRIKYQDPILDCGSNINSPPMIDLVVLQHVINFPLPTCCCVRFVVPKEGSQQNEG